MRSITLISTVHAEKGVCTVAELLRSLESFQPEVIFLEIPRSDFDEYSKQMDRWNLEYKAVNLYLETHIDTKLVPVDVHELPEDFWPNNQRLHERVEALSSEYRMLMDQNAQHIARHGFAYLNSRFVVEFWSKLDAIMDEVVDKTGEEELQRALQVRKDVNEHRETEMMKNIQKHSEAHEFNTGMFLVGAAHGSAIIENSSNPALTNPAVIAWHFPESPES